eukprot:5938741-Prymnesium_polylepis.1
MVCEIYSQDALLPGTSDADMLHRMGSLLGGFDQDSWPEGAHLADRAHMKLPPAANTSLADEVIDASEQAISLVSALLAWDPLKRPTCHEALNHEFITQAPPEDRTSMGATLAKTPRSSRALKPRGRGTQVDGPSWATRSGRLKAEAKASDEQQLRKLFDQFDVDKTGNIDLLQLRLLLAQEGLHENAYELLGRLDANSTGFVEFNELAQWWATRHDGDAERAGRSSKADGSASEAPERSSMSFEDGVLPSEEDIDAALAEMFSHYDTDSSGQISVSELVPLLRDLG